MARRKRINLGTPKCSWPVSWHNLLVTREQAIARVPACSVRRCRRWGLKCWHIIGSGGYLPLCDTHARGGSFLLHCRDGARIRIERKG